MIALGLTIAARFASEELVGGLLNLLTWPMMLLSGVWFSLEGSPRWVQWVADIFPLTQVIEAARAVMLDGAGIAADHTQPDISCCDDARVPCVRRVVVPLESRLSQPMRFCSDNTASVSAEILAALAAANHDLVLAYGEDPWTRRLDEVLGKFFGTEVRAFAVTTGTAANALALATLTPPYGAIYCHPEAHIAVDECGAPGFFTGRRAARADRGGGGKAQRRGAGRDTRRPRRLGAQCTAGGGVDQPGDGARHRIPTR